MKTLKFLVNHKKIALLLAILSFIFIPLACSKKITFENSKIVPAARGEVIVKKDNNENYNIELKLSNLAEPSRLTPPRSTYVVWLESEDNSPQNIGQIVGTNNLNVKFKTVSASKPKRIYITAEDSADVQYPGNMRILETSLF